MANFQTHIISGVIVSGLSSTVLIAGTLVTPMEALGLTLIGVVGSLLPDIDLEESRQSKYLFAGLGLFIGFIALFKYAQTYSIVELWAIWLGIYVLFRYVFWKAFNAYTVHRGVVHSLFTATLFSLLTVVVASRAMGQSDTLAWMAGLFMMIGFLTHLVFDELYSIDFGGRRIKRSFGTALKLFDYRKPASAAFLAVCIAATFFMTPPSDNFRSVVGSKDNWEYLAQRFLPYDGWFGIETPADYGYSGSKITFDYLPVQKGAPTSTGSVK